MASPASLTHPTSPASLTSRVSEVLHLAHA